MIRPELRAVLYRLREVIAAGLTAVLGLWLIHLGGLILIPAGLGLLALGLGWALAAWRRLHFVQEVQAPGLVEVDEGQIGYFGPRSGGCLALADLVELRLIWLGGHRLWRLRQLDGQALLIPVDAQGSERLFDAFAALPGIDMAQLVAALSETAGPAARATGATVAAPATIAGESRLLWSRRHGAAVQPFS